MTHLLLEYSHAEDYLARRGEFREGHLALLQAATERGELILAGAVADPYDVGLYIWREDARAAIDAFVAADPYRANGLVTAWRVRTWNTAVGTAMPPA